MGQDGEGNVSIKRYLDLFQHYRTKKIFRTSDFVTFLGRDEAMVRVELSRLVSGGIVARLSKGLYANPFDPPSAEDLAMVLRSPAYLSLESALSRHGILSQAPTSFSLVTTDLTRTFKALDLEFEYHHIQRAYFSGFQRQGPLDVAVPEKALLDLVYLRVIRTHKLSSDRLRSLLDDMDLESLRMTRLRRFARLMGMEDWLDRSFPR